VPSVAIYCHGYAASSAEICCFINASTAKLYFSLAVKKKQTINDINKNILKEYNTGQYVLLRHVFRHIVQKSLGSYFLQDPSHVLISWQ